MPLTFTTGNIFDSKAQTLVNPVNCVGTMGAGLAKQFAHRYPNMVPEYKRICRATPPPEPGGGWLWRGDKKQVLCIFTKDHWRDPSQLEWIDDGVFWFCQWYPEYRIKSVAFPALGCGYGGLAWSDVKPLMTRYLERLPIAVEVYEPEGGK